VGCVMVDDTRVGTAMLTLQLRAAVQEAVQAEASFGDRDSARDELRGRLAVLVDRRRTDLAAELATEREAAVRRIETARREAAVIMEAAAIVDASTMVTNAPAPSAVAFVAAVAAPALSGRARGAQLGLQLRNAVRQADLAERDETVAREVRDNRLAATATLEQRRREHHIGITAARTEAAALVSAARLQAAALIAAPATKDDVVGADEVIEAIVPVVEPVVEPVVVPGFVAPLVVAESVSEPVPTPAQPAPLNVVIDAEAFARVFAAVFATMFDERIAAWRPDMQVQQPYPTQMYSVGQFALPQPAQAPVKQSFWSHAKHVDVLLLSAAMVIVLVVLAAWLV